MSHRQLDLFWQQPESDSPLKDRHVCLTGNFRVPRKELKEKLMAVGAKGIKQQDRSEDDEEDGEKYRFSPTKYTHFLVVGSEPNEEALKRVALNAHDGFHARTITEEKLYEYLLGQYTDEDMVPKKLKKCISIDMSYYRWEAPVINDVTFTSRLSSPLQYAEDGSGNPVARKEIYVPDTKGADALRQLIGNFGGYGNAEYFDDTNVVMLSNETLEKLERGIKDDVIIDIESKYNNSNSNIFNVQFTSEADFIKWVKKRMGRLQDESTMALLEYYRNKQWKY